MEIYIGLAVVALILIWAVMTYNRFISLRRFKDEAWSGLRYNSSADTIWFPTC